MLAKAHCPYHVDNSGRVTEQVVHTQGKHVEKQGMLLESNGYSIGRVS
jgi:hypothetical protein